MPRRFDDWLEQTEELQRSLYGVDPLNLPKCEWLDYVRLNFLAAHTELSEALQLLPWKPWRPSDSDVLDDDQIVAELVDVLHHVANILVALGVDDDELRRVYDEIDANNHKRPVVT